MENQLIKFLRVVLTVVFLSNIYAAAQHQQNKYNWLDAKPLPSWSERSRAILKTKKISAAELKRCAVVVRQPTLAADRILTGMNWTLVGDAQVFGATSAVTVATGFDGMCRPLGFQTVVFVGNRAAGTISPAPMDSRTDGSLVNVKLTTETSLTADYVRYTDSDALCCPSKLNKVSFTIAPDGQNWLLKPEFVTEAAYNMSEAKETATPDDDAPPTLTKTVWRWQSAENSQEKTTIDPPRNYQIEFMADGKIGVKADCNTGGGSYAAEANRIKFSRIFTTKAFCGENSFDTRFLRNLEQAQTFRIEGNMLVIEGAEKMSFFRVSRQN